METYHIYYIIGALILCSAPLLLLMLAHVQSEPNNKPETGFEFSGRDIWRQLREENTHMASLSQLLRQAGVFTSGQQLQTLSLVGIIIAGIGLCLAVFTVVRGTPPLWILGGTLLAIVGLTYFSYYILKKVAFSRQERLDKETLLLVQTTRMLWRVGLSLPKTMSIVCDQLQELAPTCAQELQQAVNKIEAGQSQEEALYELINSTSAEGFKEYLVVIRQQAISGGGIDHAMNELCALLQNRRKLKLHEDVNKLAGKMSLVMMIFLFPALLFIIGGPSFLQLSKAVAALGG